MIDLQQTICESSPQCLAANTIPRIVRGGPAIAAFRGDPGAAGERMGEDWIGSVTTARGRKEIGLSRLPDGRFLRDAIQAAPERYLGPDHVAAYGSETGLLVKLLDAAERLMVHAHPSRAFVARHLGGRWGKSEGWIVLETSSPDACVYLGFKDDVDPETLAGWVREQQSEELLDALNRVPVESGDAIFVPASIPHTIGEGVFLIEVQEPADLSVILEWRDFAIDGPKVGHLQLGFDAALHAVDRRGWSPEALRELRAPRPTGGVADLFPTAADPYFGAAYVAGSTSPEFPASFAILVVVRGRGELRVEDGSNEIYSGQTWLVPHSAGPSIVAGAVDVVRCVPPDPIHVTS